MKILCKIVLGIFMLFLATPTIIAAMHKDLDVSCFFNLNEEENQDGFKEVKFITSICSFPIVLDFEVYQKVKYLILNDRKVRSIAPNVFLQPPQFI